MSGASLKQWISRGNHHQICYFMADLNLWKKLYSLYDELFSLKPWTFLFEDEIFAVKAPESQQEYFISIMGSNEEVYALSAYEGAEALYQFWDLHNSESALPTENILLIPHMMVALDDRENIPQKQRSVIKQLGLTYRGRQAWPNIERIEPAYFPAIPGDPQLRDLVHILEQSIHVIQRASKDKSFIHNKDHYEDEYLFREATMDKEQWVWNDTYRRVPESTRKEKINYTKDRLNAFNELPVGEHRLEIDLVMIPAPMKDKNKPACFPFLFLMVDPEADMILDFELMSPRPDFQTMIGSFPDTLLEKLINAGQRPRQISYKSSVIEGIMRWLEDQTDQKTEQTTNLPSLDEAANYLINSMLKQQ